MIRRERAPHVQAEDRLVNGDEHQRLPWVENEKGSGEIGGEAERATRVSTPLEICPLVADGLKGQFSKRRRQRAR
jgi:hypothetical protein